MAITDRYPNAPDLPDAHEDLGIDSDIYNVYADYIPDLVTDANRLLSDGDGNITVEDGIYWDAELLVDLNGGDLEFDRLHIGTMYVAGGVTAETVGVYELLYGLDDLVVSASGITISVGCTITIGQYVERNHHVFAATAETADPAEDKAVIWLSNGTGAGDTNDFMAKSTESSSTTTATLVDVSTL